MEGAVIHIGSMSKLIAPAMRTGFMVADRRFTDQILPLKAAASKGVTGIVQYVLYRMLEENDMYVQIGKICDAYRKKLLEMERCMDRYFPAPVKHSSPDGGMYIWVTMPEGTNCAGSRLSASIYRLRREMGSASGSRRNVPACGLIL